MKTVRVHYAFHNPEHATKVESLAKEIGLLNVKYTTDLSKSIIVLDFNSEQLADDFRTALKDRLSALAYEVDEEGHRV